jgi:hypothetical protein
MNRDTDCTTQVTEIWNGCAAREEQKVKGSWQVHLANFLRSAANNKEWVDILDCLFYIQHRRTIALMVRTHAVPALVKGGHAICHMTRRTHSDPGAAHDRSNSESPRPIANLPRNSSRQHHTQATQSFRLGSTTALSLEQPCLSSDTARPCAASAGCNPHDRSCLRRRRRRPRDHSASQPSGEAALPARTSTTTPRTTRPPAGSGACRRARSRRGRRGRSRCTSISPALSSRLSYWPSSRILRKDSLFFFLSSLRRWENLQGKVTG